MRRERIRNYSQTTFNGHEAWSIAVPAVGQTSCSDQASVHKCTFPTTTTACAYHVLTENKNLITVGKGARG